MHPPQTLDRLSPPDVAAVRQLVSRTAEADHVGPMSEHVLLHLPAGGDAGVRHVLVRDDDGAEESTSRLAGESTGRLAGESTGRLAGESTGRLAGYAHLDVTDLVAGPSAELAVDPALRRRGVGRALVERLLDEAPDGRLRLWAHGDGPAAAALAQRLGFARTRVLLQMRRPLTDPLPDVALPAGVDVRAFEPGRDEAAWLEVNSRAFATHPEQGRWGREELDLRMAEPWFDPAGFFLAERDGRLVGFHWTKVHGGGSGEAHGHDPVGEVYVVGVDPSEQGRGLGPALTLVGLHSLRDRGLGEVLLYVDESNVAAVRTYERLGFAVAATDVCYARG